MHDLLVLVTIGAATFLLRGAFLLSPSVTPPPSLRRVLPYVGPAVLAAIAVPPLLGTHGTIQLSEAAGGTAAAVVAGLICRRSGSVPLALFGGLGAWWLIAMIVAG
jgi:branched-subunit amino acid transport protein